MGKDVHMKRLLLGALALSMVLTGCGAAATVSGQTDAPPAGKCLVVRTSDGAAISCNYGR